MGTSRVHRSPRQLQLVKGGSMRNFAYADFAAAPADRGDSFSRGRFLSRDRVEQTLRMGAPAPDRANEGGRFPSRAHIHDRPPCHHTRPNPRS